MTDVLDNERIQRFRQIRNDLLKRRDALQIRLNHMRELRIRAEQDLRDLDIEIGAATRHLRHAEIPISDYIAEIVKADDEGRGYFAQIVARANALKDADMLRQTGALERGQILYRSASTPQPKAGNGTPRQPHGETVEDRPSKADADFSTSIVNQQS